MTDPNIPREVLDNYLFTVAHRVHLAAEVGVGSLEDLIDQALSDRHHVYGFVVLEGETSIFQASDWAIPDARHDQFRLLCAYLDAHMAPGQTSIKVDNATNLIGRAEAWQLRMQGHGRQPAQQPRKRRLAGS